MSGRRSRIALTLGLLAALVVAAPAQAHHAFGTLDCGAAGAYDVDGTRTLPSGFEAPVPFSGLFLLEGTTSVFRALSIDGQAFPFSRPAASRYPGTILSCTLTSSGFGFPTGSWSLTGVLTP